MISAESRNPYALLRRTYVCAYPCTCAAKIDRCFASEDKDMQTKRLMGGLDQAELLNQSVTSN
jgi:hypothetical protein